MEILEYRSRLSIKLNCDRALEKFIILKKFQMKRKFRIRIWENCGGCKADIICSDTLKISSASLFDGQTEHLGNITLLESEASQKSGFAGVSAKSTFTASVNAKIINVTTKLLCGFFGLRNSLC